MNSIPEADWKVFKRVHAAALERFCAKVLDEVRQLTAKPGNSSHETYLKIYNLIQRRDKELADTFNDYRRSTAFWQLAVMLRLGLVTDEEFAQLSDQTRSKLSAVREITGG